MILHLPSESQKKRLGALTDRYHNSLTGEVLSYLESRGIGQDAVTGYRLGLVSDPDPLHEQYVGRLSIPFITPTGVVHMRFRCLEDHECGDLWHGKYEGVSGEENRLYNVSALHSAMGVVGICEGELDAVVASTAGLASVGVPGASGFKRHWYRLFDDFETIYVLGDGDAAGRKFTNELSANLRGARALPMPKGYDVSSYVQEFGAEAFQKFLSE